MVRIEVGKTYVAKRARTGQGGNGKTWELIVVESESGKEELTLWVTNIGQGVMDGGQFRVKSIDSVCKKPIPLDAEGKIIRDRKVKPIRWGVDATVNVTIERVGFGEMPFAFEELPDSFSAENPFENDSDLPFTMDDTLPL